MRVAVFAGIEGRSRTTRAMRTLLPVPPAFALTDPAAAASAPPIVPPRLFHAPCGLVVAVRNAHARLFLLAPDDFTETTAASPPSEIDPRAGYGGWRLP